METKDNQTLDLAALGRFMKRNWYWFIISTLLIAVLAGLFYATRPKTYSIEMTVRLYTEEESVLVPTAAVIPTANRPTDAGDEKAMIISWDVIRDAINETKLNAVYFKKQNLRWIEQSANSSAIQASWTNEAISQLYAPFTITVDIKDDQIFIKTQTGHKKASYTINSLENPWTSPEGFTISARQELKAGNQYRVMLFTVGSRTGWYYSDFKTDYPRRSKQAVELKATTKYPNNTIAIMRKQIEVYNRVTLAQRKALTQQTIDALDKRIDETTNTQLKLILMQRREDKILSLDATPQPATIISSPHVMSEAVSPSLQLIILLTLCLGLGLPFVVLYIIFVIRSQK